MRAKSGVKGGFTLCPSVSPAVKIFSFTFTNRSVGRAILRLGDRSSIIKVIVGTDVGN